MVRLEIHTGRFGLVMGYNDHYVIHPDPKWWPLNAALWCWNFPKHLNHLYVNLLRDFA